MMYCINVIYQGNYYITDCESQWFITQSADWTGAIKVAMKHIITNDPNYRRARKMFILKQLPLIRVIMRSVKRIVLIDTSLFTIWSNFTIFYCPLNDHCLHNSTWQLSFTRTPVRVSKMNTVARAQLTFQMLTLLKKNFFGRMSSGFLLFRWPWYVLFYFYLRI